MSGPEKSARREGVCPEAWFWDMIQELSLCAAPSPVLSLCETGPLAMFCFCKANSFISHQLHLPKIACWREYQVLDKRTEERWVFFQVLHLDHGVDLFPISTQPWRREVTLCEMLVSVMGLAVTHQHDYLGLLPLLADENEEKSSRELV